MADMLPAHSRYKIGLEVGSLSRFRQLPRSGECLWVVAGADEKAWSTGKKAARCEPGLGAHPQLTPNRAATVRSTSGRSLFLPLGSRDSLFTNRMSPPRISIADRTIGQYFTIGTGRGFA